MTSAKWIPAVPAVVNNGGMMLLNTVVEWERKLAVRRSTVLFVTLWMTYKAFDWAAQYAVIDHNGDALAAAAIIAAVTAPITYLQKVVFDAYIASKDAP